MMGKHDWSRLALCPYYKCESRPTIYCEGVEENSTIHISFASPADAKAYKNKHCRADYCSCLIYAMIDRRYSDSV